MFIFIYNLILEMLKVFFGIELFFNKYLIKNKTRFTFQALFLKFYKIDFGRNIYFNKVPFILKPENIFLGDNCSFGENTKFYNHTTIRIGDNFLGAPGISFLTGGHNPETLEGITKPIVIGKGCWCAYNVTILPGVTIGDNVSIGSCSVVTKDIESNSIAVGSPARVVRKFKLKNRYTKNILRD